VTRCWAAYSTAAADVTCDQAEGLSSSRLNDPALRSESRPTRRDDAENQRGLNMRFETEVLPLVRMLKASAQRLTTNHADAEDLLQDTLTKAYIRFHTYTAQSNVRAWLVQIMRNCWIDRYRRDKSRPAEHLIGDHAGFDSHGREHHSQQPQSGSDYRWQQSEGDSRLEQALGELPVELQRAVYFAYVEGVPQKEIAQIERIPLGTVVSRLARAREKLRRRLTMSPHCESPSEATGGKARGRCHLAVVRHEGDICDDLG
jgi:RNA polymerase sigma-70 factor, ECF subfamily